MSSSESYLYYRGRVALYHMLRLLGVREGDEVLLQAFTCVAVPEAIMATGATPAWVDIAPGTVNLDAVDLARKISPRAKAVVVQHTFGIPTEMRAVSEVVESHSLPIVEDCCHGSESIYRNSKIGTLGTGAFWSYEWGKPVIAGVGGEARYNDSSMQKRANDSYHLEFALPPTKRSAVIAAQYFLHHQLYRPHSYWRLRKIFRAFGRAGIAESNYNPMGSGMGKAPDFDWRMTDFSQRRIESARARAVAFLPERRRQASHYAAILSRSHGVRLLAIPASCETVYSRFPLIVSEKEALLRAAASKNLEIADWYNTPVHPLKGNDLKFVNYEQGSCPVAELAANTLVSLPINSRVTQTFQDNVCRLVAEHASNCDWQPSAI